MQDQDQDQTPQQDSAQNSGPVSAAPGTLTPTHDAIGRQLRVGDLVQILPTPELLGLFRVTDCRVTLNPGFPPGTHLLVLESRAVLPIAQGSQLPVLRVATLPTPAQSGQEGAEHTDGAAAAPPAPSPLILPGSDRFGKKGH